MFPFDPGRRTPIGEPLSLRPDNLPAIASRRQSGQTPNAFVIEIGSGSRSADNPLHAFGTLRVLMFVAFIDVPNSGCAMV